MIGLPLSAARLSLPCPGWAISTDGSFWKIAATATIGMFSLHEIQRDEGVRREVEVEPAGGEQLRVIDLRSALPQRHLEPVLPVNPGGDRLVVAAVLGLGLPIRAEADRFRGRRAATPGPRPAATNMNGTDHNPHSRQLPISRAPASLDGGSRRPSTAAALAKHDAIVYRSLKTPLRSGRARAGSAR